MIYTLVRKDLLLELRTKEIIIPMFAFGLAIIMIFALSFNASQAINHAFSPGLLWIIILFMVCMIIDGCLDLSWEWED